MLYSEKNELNKIDKNDQRRRKSVFSERNRPSNELSKINNSMRKRSYSKLSISSSECFKEPEIVFAESRIKTKSISYRLKELKEKEHYHLTELKKIQTEIQILSEEQKEYEKTLLDTALDLKSKIDLESLGEARFMNLILSSNLLAGDDVSALCDICFKVINLENKPILHLKCRKNYCSLCFQIHRSHYCRFCQTPLSENYYKNNLSAINEEILSILITSRFYFF